MSSLRDGVAASVDVQVEWLCAAAAFLFSPEAGSELPQLMDKNFGWKIITDGIASQDSFVKKQSIYLFKRWLDHMFRLVTISITTTEFHFLIAKSWLYSHFGVL